MKIIVIYGTNSGGTYLAAQIIAEVLTTSDHEVTVKNATEADYHELENYDLIVVGSNTWNFSKEEGLPHEEVRKFLNKISYNNLILENKNLAVYGLGDSSYMYFCGSVDVLEKFFNERQVKLVIPSLRIDGFYFRQAENTEKIKAWAAELGNALS